jgi:hypothetical protein
METSICNWCGKRFKSQDWKNAFEKGHCFTCRVELKIFMNCLSPKEQRVLALRFGLEEPWITRTLEEIGNEFGVTRERIRQIEAKAFERMIEAGFSKADKRVHDKCANCGELNEHYHIGKGCEGVGFVCKNCKKTNMIEVRIVSISRGLGMKRLENWLKKNTDDRQLAH